MTIKAKDWLQVFKFYAPFSQIVIILKENGITMLEGS